MGRSYGQTWFPREAQHVFGSVMWLPATANWFYWQLPLNQYSVINLALHGYADSEMMYFVPILAFLTINKLRVFSDFVWFSSRRLHQFIFSRSHADLRSIRAEPPSHRDALALAASA